MALFLSNRDGDGKTSEEGHYRFQTRVFEGEVLHVNDLNVTQNSPLNMNVLMAVGDFRIETSAGYAYTGWSNSIQSIPINTADPANPRITSIVLYIDRSAATSPSPPNNPGIPKIMAVDGVAAAVPTSPSDSDVQSAVGMNNPYIVISDVTVPSSAIQIINANISDKRIRVKLTPDVLSSSDMFALVGPLVYPIGSVYTNYSNSTNPGTIFGFGTWVAITGRVVVGLDASQTEFDTQGETGGTKTETLTLAQTPVRTGTITLHSAAVATNISSATGAFGSGLTNGQYATTSGPINGASSVGIINYNNGGGGGSHNNLQPYVVAYVWRRTA